MNKRTIKARTNTHDFDITSRELFSLLFWNFSSTLLPPSSFIQFNGVHNFLYVSRFHIVAKARRSFYSSFTHRTLNYSLHLKQNRLLNNNRKRNSLVRQRHTHTFLRHTTGCWHWLLKRKTISATEQRRNGWRYRCVACIDDGNRWLK